MFSSPPNQANELRLLHWNIHSSRDDAGASNVESVVNLVRATNPHVVSLVEVDETWGHPSTLDEVANRCGYASIFVPAFEYGNDSPTGGFGNALLSKLPILAVRQRQLVWPPRLHDGSEPRRLQHASLCLARCVSSLGWVSDTSEAHLPNQGSGRAN